jgi:hypothetical protein
MTTFAVDSLAGAEWWVQVRGQVPFQGWALRRLSVRVRTPFPTSNTARQTPYWREVRSQDRWVREDWTPFCLSAEQGNWSLSGWVEKGWERGWQAMEQDLLGLLRDQVIPDLERSLKFRSRKQAVKPLARELKLSKGDLDWIGLSLLKPRVQLEGEGLGELQVRLSLGEEPWPEGIRPWDLALERFPELWLYLA